MNGVPLYTVSVLLNLSARRLKSFTAADQVGAWPQLLGFVVPGESVLAGLERMWDVGNNMTADADGRAWPRHLRSLSVGDVCLIAGTGEPVQAFSVELAGWREWPDQLGRLRAVAAAALGARVGPAIGHGWTRLRCVGACCQSRCWREGDA